MKSDKPVFILHFPPLDKKRPFRDLKKCAEYARQLKVPWFISQGNQAVLVSLRCAPKKLKRQKTRMILSMFGAVLPQYLRVNKNAVE